jgi:hypothetical protein
MRFGRADEARAELPRRNRPSPGSPRDGVCRGRITAVRRRPARRGSMTAGSPAPARWWRPADMAAASMPSMTMHRRPAHQLLGQDRAGRSTSLGPALLQALMRAPGGSRRPARHWRPCDRGRPRPAAELGCRVINSRRTALGQALGSAISAPAVSATWSPEAITAEPAGIGDGRDQMALRDPGHGAAHDGIAAAEELAAALPQLVSMASACAVHWLDPDPL